MKEINVYTDGACRGNPGPGGWGTILEYKGKVRELSGGENPTTNNRMELTAAISGLKALREPCKVKLWSDSQYLVKAINEGWLADWIKRGWKKSDKSPVLNDDLWRELVTLLEVHEVEFVWVRGHNGHPQNERCDALAVAEAEKFGELK